MTRKFLIFILFTGLFSGWFFSSAPEAKAIDPVTIAILTPIAIKGAQIAMPYVLKGLSNMGKASLKAFPDLINIFKLPIGLGMTLLMWPFRGCFVRGLSYTAQGLIAPFKLTFHIIMIPIAAFGVNVN